MAPAQSSSRDTPFPAAPATTTSDTGLCVGCRQTLMSEQAVVVDEFQLGESAPFEAQAHASLSRSLPARSPATNMELPSLSRPQQDTFRSTWSSHLTPAADRDASNEGNARDPAHSPMSLDRQTHASEQPSATASASALDFGPHLMSRSRISTLPQPPHERVSSQHPIALYARPQYAIGSSLSASTRSIRRDGKYAQNLGGKAADMDASMSSAPTTHLVPALSHPYSSNLRTADRGQQSGGGRQEPYRTFFDPGRPDPLQDVTYIRRLPTSRGCLHPGARFEGSQTSDKSSYGVTVIFTHVDLEASHLCGTINIRGLTEDWPELITFFDAEIIGLKHGFVTGKWGASETQDAKHWGRFAPFKPLRKFLDKPDLRFDHFNKPYVFMRWKERFLVPDHRVKNVTGASYDGFYYVCLALDPDEGDPVLPLPLHETVNPATSSRTFAPSRYPSAADAPNATRASIPHLADVIMNSPTGRIPSTYSPSWNPATSYMSRTMASLRQLEAVARGGGGGAGGGGEEGGQSTDSTYLGSGPTVVGSAGRRNVDLAVPEDVGIAAFARTLGREGPMEPSRSSLSATAAGLVPSLPQPRANSAASLSVGQNSESPRFFLSAENGAGAGVGASSSTAAASSSSGANAARRTFTSRTMSDNGAWVEVTQMEVEVEAEADSGSASDSTAAASAEVVGADAVCDPPLVAPATTTTVQATAAAAAGSADSDLVRDGVVVGLRPPGAGRQSSRGLLDATLTQGSTRPRHGPPSTTTEQSVVESGDKAGGAGASPREAVVGRCVGYYYSEQSEPFQQISLRYVPERPIGSFELR
ncbi:unnamed protein product [Tilletia controversa]|nr:unnamed protein product [Tilletia controversa]